ncbi:hypothetical protein TSAR_010589 [Trichomalopsis sarcophagae]|uniref:Uncharacterized protein n=1 Tax=Trichomalopsis sarcophagae TaxID=543379 RepID=A0A232EN75_9HYME|nr:hypothetical protein TSAR_010589 [Trichomalopsis sarcophagae]
MYRTNKYPENWKCSFTIFIKKADGKGVRPISLGSCVCKVFETLVKNKLQYWVEKKKNIIPKSQSGFRKGQNTVDNLVNLTLHVEQSFNDIKDLLAASIIAPGKIVIEVKNVKIKTSGTVRFLGILFDYKLTLKSMNIIKFLRRTWWGADANTLLILYKSFVHYANFVYFPTNKQLVQKLERIQYAALRLSLGYRNSTPTNVILAESKMLTIEDRTIYLCHCHLYTILSNRNLIVNETIRSLKKK